MLNPYKETEFYPTIPEAKHVQAEETIYRAEKKVSTLVYIMSQENVH